MTTTARGGDAGAVASWRLWVVPLAALARVGRALGRARPPPRVPRGGGVSHGGFLPPPAPPAGARGGNGVRSRRPPLSRRRELDGPAGGPGRERGRPGDRRRPDGPRPCPRLVEVGQADRGPGPELLAWTRSSSPRWSCAGLQRRFPHRRLRPAA